MRKWTSTALGGAPVYDDDLLDIFNSEIWGAMQAIFSPYDSDTEGVIVSGCVISGSGPYNISAGIVYLNGEFMRINAFTSLSLPFYIQPDTVTTEPRTFADSTVNAVITVKIATVGGSAPGSGQYIAVTSPTDPDDRRYGPTPWVTMNLINGWASGAGVISTGAIPQYRIESGRVYLKGTLYQAGSTSRVFADNLPKFAVTLGAIRATGLGNAAATATSLDIDSSGNGQIADSGATVIVTYLDGLNYALN